MNNRQSYTLTLKRNVIEFAEKSGNKAAKRHFNLKATKCVRNWRK